MCFPKPQRDLGPGQDWSLAAHRRSCNENVYIIPFPIGSMYAIFTLYLRYIYHKFKPNVSN